jgi:hypothetical protein
MPKNNVWLVVWNMAFIFSIIYGIIIIPSDFHIFQEGLKPPTSHFWLVYTSIFDG